MTKEQALELIEDTFQAALELEKIPEIAGYAKLIKDAALRAWQKVAEDTLLDSVEKLNHRL